LLAATGMIAAGLPFAFGQGSAGQQPKSTAAVEPSAQSIDMPDWQKLAGGKMSFDLASIRLSKPGSFTPPNIPFGPDGAYHPTGGLLKANFPLMAYIAFAYKLWLTQEQEKAMMVHLPKWVATDTFIIQAKVEGNPTKDQMRLMMQSLLADRFKLALHLNPKKSLYSLSAWSSLGSWVLDFIPMLMVLPAMSVTQTYFPSCAMGTTAEWCQIT
jgi:hypothetical protein